MMQRSSRLAALLHHEAAGGVILLAAALLALVISNSPLAWAYEALLDTPASIRIGKLALDKPLLLWINDGLMAIFFFHIGLEVKRELLVGSLSSARRALLPMIAAGGGMAVPALVYALINRGDANALQGWAIPAATDIAFAVGVLALLGSRIPPSLKVFLLALAIADDLGAIVIIAVFYAHDLAPLALGLGLAGLAALVALNRAGVKTLAPYIVMGLFMWACVLKSGVHATLAGVALAFAIPLNGDASNASPLDRAEAAVAPWVHFAIAPIFAFANAGVSLQGLNAGSMLGGIPLGIAAGLFIGKQLGIFASAWAAVKLGVGEMPQGATWLQIYGTAVLGGIGFTMSLFIGTLAFPDPSYALPVRVGVLAGSLASGLLGYAVLRSTSRDSSSEAFQSGA